MSGKQRGGTPALVQLQESGVTFRVHSFEHTPGERNFGLAAANALGVDPAQVFKTLLTRVDGEPTVAIVPVDRQLSLKALAATLQAKRCEMMPPADAERLTGYVVGGISPFGQRRRSTTVIDETAVLFEVVYVSGGQRGLDIEIAPDDLVQVLGASFADIAT